MPLVNAIPIPIPTLNISAKKPINKIIIAAKIELSCDCTERTPALTDF